MTVARRLRRPRPLPAAALLLLLLAPQVASAQPAEAPDALGSFAVGYRAFDLADPEPRPAPDPLLAELEGCEPREPGDRILATTLWYPVTPGEDVGAPAFYDSGIFGFGLESAVAVEDAPAAAPPGGFPLIVFSHGSGGINTQSTPLMETLASHGFIVVSPNHTGNTAVDFFFTSAICFPQAALDRPPDVSFVIDQMLAWNEDPASPLFGRIDPSRIGVAGHSFGGFTSIAMAAGFEGRPPDTRVRAIAPIAPAADLFGDFALSQIWVPIFVLGGTLDTTTPIFENSTRPFEIPRSPRIYRADVIGATHTAFANVCEIGEVLRSVGSPDDFIADLVPGWLETCGPTAAIEIGEVQRLQNLYLVSFFRRWLNGEAEYDFILDPAYTLANEPAVTYFAETRSCGEGFAMALALPAFVVGRKLRRRSRS